MNFNIDNFADSLERLAAKLRQPELAQAAAVINGNDALFANAPRPADGFWISAQWDRPPRTFALPPVVALTDDSPKADDSPDAAAVNPDAAIAGDEQAAPPPNSVTGRAVFDSVVPPTAALPPPKSEPAQRPAPAEKSPSPTTGPNSVAGKPAPANAKLAVREGELDHKRDMTAADNCSAHPGKGHLARSCQPDHLQNRERGRQADQAAERKTAHENRGTRHHGEAPARRNASRRGRA